MYDNDAREADMIRSSLVRTFFVPKSRYITVITPVMAFGMRAQNSVLGTILNHVK